jgi:hypothetical protein
LAIPRLITNVCFTLSSRTLGAQRRRVMNLEKPLNFVEEELRDARYKIQDAGW